jgi:hypothetical protein
MGRDPAQRCRPSTDPAPTPCALQYCDEWGYLTIGLCTALPCFLVPPLLPNKADAGKPLAERYWVKVGARPAPPARPHAMI